MRKLPILCVFIIAAMFASCKKSSPDADKDDPQTGGGNETTVECVVSKVTITERYKINGEWREYVDKLSFAYDDKGRITSIANDEVYATLKYQDGEIVTIANPGFGDLSLNYKLDASDKVTTVTQPDNDDIVVEYSGSQVVKASSPEALKWRDGNIVETTWNWDNGQGFGDKLTYEYSTHEVKNINLRLNFLYVDEWESMAFFLDEYCDIHPVELQGFFGDGSKNYISRIAGTTCSGEGYIYKDMVMDYTFSKSGAPTQIIRNVYSKESETSKGELISTYTIDVEYVEE